MDVRGLESDDTYGSAHEDRKKRWSKYLRSDWTSEDTNGPRNENLKVSLIGNISRWHENRIRTILHFIPENDLKNIKNFEVKDYEGGEPREYWDPESKTIRILSDLHRPQKSYVITILRLVARSNWASLPREKKTELAEIAFEDNGDLFMASTHAAPYAKRYFDLKHDMDELDAELDRLEGDGDHAKAERVRSELEALMKREPELGGAAVEELYYETYTYEYDYMSNPKIIEYDDDCYDGYWHGESGSLTVKAGSNNDEKSYTHVMNQVMAHTNWPYFPKEKKEKWAEAASANDWHLFEASTHARGFLKKCIDLRRQMDELDAEVDKLENEGHQMDAEEARSVRKHLAISEQIWRDHAMNELYCEVYSWKYSSFKDGLDEVVMDEARILFDEIFDEKNTP